MSEQGSPLSSGGESYASAATRVPADKRASYWEDFIDIFYAPSAVFRRREHAGFGVPMLVVTVLITVIAVATTSALQPVLDAEAARVLVEMQQRRPDLPPNAGASLRTGMELTARWGPLLMIPVMMFLVGLALWVVGKAVDAKQSLGASIMVASYAFVPRVVGSLVNGVQGLLLDPSTLNGFNRLSIGPARFVDADSASRGLVLLLTRLDLWTLWSTVLLAIGLSVTGKVSRAKGALAAAAVWVLASALMLARTLG